MSRPRFPDILFQLLGQGLDAVRWSPCGAMVILVDGPELFSVLAPYVRTRYFRSVTRQLNMYGFEKVQSVKEHYQYSHPNFRREAPHLLPAVRRYSAFLTADDKARSNGARLRAVIKQQLIRIAELEARILALDGGAARAVPSFATSAVSSYIMDNVDSVLHDARQEALDAQLCKSMPPDARAWEEAIHLNNWANQ